MSSASAPAFRWRAILGAILRESRAARGRLLFFAACLATGVAAVVGVRALVAAMNDSLQGSSRELLAADLRVSARRPLPAELDRFFAGVAHERTDVRELAAMLSVLDGREPSEARLTELKVVEGTYPLHGELLLDPPQNVAALGEDGVFLAPELMEPLGLKLGDEVAIGGATFRILARIQDEPDRLDFAMTLGPRVFLGPQGLARTDLLQAQSRVQYRALFRIDREPDELEALAEALEEGLPDATYLKISTHSQAQPSVGRSLERVEDYLGLVALLSLLLGGVGVSQIVRAWLAGRTRSVAILRSLGLRAREVAAIYLGHVALLALCGTLVGAVLGAAAPLLVYAWEPALFQGDTSHLWQPWAPVRGVALGCLVALVFPLPALTAVWRVPPAAVLRAEAVPLAPPASVRWGAYLALGAGVFASAWVQGGSAGLAAIFVAGLVVFTGLLAAGARALLALCARLPRERLPATLEHGLAALSRPGVGASGAIVALGLGVMVVVAMASIEKRLDDTLRNALPADAPSVFLVDVQPDQWPRVQATMQDHGARSVDSVPVVMARLRFVDGRSVQELYEDREEDGRAAWVLTREQRLTWMEELPEDNRILAGELWSDPEHAEVSLEEDFARDLGAELGSTLTFDVQGIALELVVTSLRRVDWESFAINFFLVVEPGVLDEAPHFRIAAARLEPEEAEFALQGELAAHHPNVTMLRVRPILEKVAGVLARLALGVRALGSFTILTGLVILGGAVGASALRRAREAALLKVLGVTRLGVTGLFAVEYALSGLAAGALGGIGALALSWAFLEHLVEIEAGLDWRTIPAAALGAAVLATASGLAASLRALRARPMRTLRG